ncbi:FAD-dependent oxidoreductase [Parahaliea mediterranea]|uniref:FAD-dependent oxidoreductase n=1 Tax=Parahaliea mediterranea TaxID=651086 RepID=A0A939DCZ8_9GAMM|nr:FAD-dependent oxidoreductase [Parahaliea mediterranea]MBN7795965.1 FAD-dependent oxidoreductase [Parahaliea mediterranea]
MSKHLASLSSPCRIGKMTLKNRMIVTAMGTNLGAEDGGCSERLHAFHERQARGGAGLIVLGSVGVSWPAGGNQPRQLAISRDAHIPSLKKLADAVHAHGGKLAAQLHHGGLVAAQDRAEGRPMWVPSYPEVKAGDMQDAFLESELKAMFDPEAPEPRLHVMTKDDIGKLVADFAAAAKRAVAAGIDGVEIHGGHGYIISEFLSPLANQRDDEYGGSLENRARFLLEIVAAVREAVGPNYPLWCKIDSGEFGHDEGISLADARDTAVLLERAGVDAITVSAYHNAAMGVNHSESNIPHTPERLVAGAMAIKAAVSVPVITSGRIEPKAADRHIAAGHFDMLGMGRKILADPDLPNKVMAGRLDDIRPCVYCYCCVSQIYTLNSIKCAVNPETAFETTRALIATSAARHFAVVGGGPAGMEAARRLAGRGHRVTLLEAADRLGGTLQFASIAYEPNERLLRWLRRQTQQSAVDVRLNTQATPALLRQLGADEVVVATGARRDLPDIPGKERDFVFSGDEMRALVLGEQGDSLRRKTSGLTRALTRAGSVTGANRHPWLLRQVSRAWLPLGRRIVVIGAELVGLELAEYLAHRGREVTVIDSAARAGAGLYLVRRMRLLHELRELGVVMVNRARDIAIGEQRVSYRNYRGQRRQVEAEQVIVAQGATGDQALAEQLREQDFTVHTIGDCNGVGYIEGAMESAAELVAGLD